MSIKNFKISVIVPVFNVEKFLRRCVDSILTQTFTDFELLLVDDGSTDSSGKICDEYAKKDNRVRVFHKKNGGPGSTRNYGIDHSHGKWIAFIDSDDYVGKDYLSLFVKYNTADDIYTQVIQGFHLVGNEKSAKRFYKITRYVDTVVHVGMHSDYLDNNGLLNRWEIWGRVFSAQVLRENGIRFDESIKVCEDAIFWHTYICNIHTLHFISEREYYYYRPFDENSITAKHGFDLQENFTITIAYSSLSEKLVNMFKLSPQYSHEVYEWYLGRYRNLLKNCSLMNVDQTRQLEKLQPTRVPVKLSAKDYVFAAINLIPVKLIVAAIRFLEIKKT